MTFTTQRLTNHRVLVKDTNGSEVKTTVLDSEQWDEIKRHQQFDVASDAFDEAVKNFFAPLTEAADAAEKAFSMPEDTLGIIVMHEGVEGIEEQPTVVISLTHDSMVLRLIESGDTSRLVWVNDELEILEVAVPVAPVVVPEQFGNEI